MSFGSSREFLVTLRNLGPVRRHLVGGVSGAITSWLVAGAIYYYPAQQAALAEGETIDFQVWPVLTIGAAGAVLGAFVVGRWGVTRLPRLLGHLTWGVLAGVAGAVSVTLAVASLNGRPWDKWHAGLLHLGLTIGVPLGATLGGIAGCLVSVVSARKAEQTNGAKIGS
jgi:hypothetical protein